MDGVALLEYFLWGVVVVLISLIAKRLMASNAAPVAPVVARAPEANRGPIHLSLAELAKYDGKDTNLPLYIAVKVR